MTILTSVTALGEIAFRYHPAVATSPCRWQLLWVSGWLRGMLTAYIALMVGGVNAVTYVMAGVTVPSSRAGLLTDLDGKFGAAFGHVCFCCPIFLL